MEKLKVYQLATVGLLLLNLGLLAFVFLAPRRGGPSPHHAKEMLHLDAAQNEIFLALARAHQTEMRGLNERQRRELQRYFDQLKTADATTPPPIPTELGKVEGEKISSTYRHFLDVREMLRPEQETHFPGFVDRMTNRILSGSGKKKRPKR